MEESYGCISRYGTGICGLHCHVQTLRTVHRAPYLSAFQEAARHRPVNMKTVLIMSPRWAYDVDLPAKTGVGGGIVAVVPGEMAVAAFSPA